MGCGLSKDQTTDDLLKSDKREFKSKGENEILRTKAKVAEVEEDSPVFIKNNYSNNVWKTNKLLDQSGPIVLNELDERSIKEYLELSINLIKGFDLKTFPISDGPKIKLTNELRLIILESIKIICFFPFDVDYKLSHINNIDIYDILADHLKTKEIPALLVSSCCKICLKFKDVNLDLVSFFVNCRNNITMFLERCFNWEDQHHRLSFNPSLKYNCSCPECCDLQFYSCSLRYRGVKTNFFFIKHDPPFALMLTDFGFKSVNTQNFHRKMILGKIDGFCLPVKPLENIKIFGVSLDQLHLWSTRWMDVFQEEFKITKYRMWDSKNEAHYRLIKNGEFTQFEEPFVFVSHVWELPDDPDPMDQTIQHCDLNYGCYWIDFLSLPQKIYEPDFSGQIKEIFTDGLHMMKEIQLKSDTDIVIPLWAREEYFHRGWCLAEFTMVKRPTLIKEYKGSMYELLNFYTKYYDFSKALQLLRIHLSDMSDATVIRKYFCLSGGVLLWDFIKFELSKLDHRVKKTEK